MPPERLSVQLFGPPVFAWRGQRLSILTRKATALLCYAALRGSTPRTDLTELLWGVGQQRNLRLELHRLRQLPGAASWLLTDALVHVNAQSDVEAFETALRDRDFAGALSVYSSAPEQLLMRDLEPKAAPAFGDWLELETAHKLGEALETARQLLALDPLNEAAHRTVIRLECAWERGQAVYISGPPSIGKTRLLLDFAQDKTAGNFSLVQGLVGDKSVPLRWLGLGTAISELTLPRLSSSSPG